MNAELYKWTDDEGNTHYSDEAPKEGNSKYDKVEISTVNNSDSGVREIGKPCQRLHSGYRDSIYSAKVVERTDTKIKIRVCYFLNRYYGKKILISIDPNVDVPPWPQAHIHAQTGLNETDIVLQSWLEVASRRCLLRSSKNINWRV